MSVSDAEATRPLLGAAAFDGKPREPLWPAAVIVFGISLTAGWTILLGYGLVKLVYLAISQQADSAHLDIYYAARHTIHATVSIDGNIATITPSTNSSVIDRPHCHK